LVVGDLKAQEFMDCLEGIGIPGADSDAAATVETLESIAHFLF